MKKKSIIALTLVLLFTSGGLFARHFRLSEKQINEIVEEFDDTVEDPQDMPQESSIEQEVAGTEIIKVTKVVDGDTIVVEGEHTIRLIGVDTPETVDPRRPVGCYGKEASNFTKILVQGKHVRLEKDISETDKYGRVLRYVFVQTENGELFVNDIVARQGYAMVKTYPPDVKYEAQLLQAQQEARENNRGLWSKCTDQ